MFVQWLKTGINISLVMGIFFPRDKGTLIVLRLSVSKSQFSYVSFLKLVCLWSRFLPIFHKKAHFSRFPNFIWCTASGCKNQLGTNKREYFEILESVVLRIWIIVKSGNSPLSTRLFLGLWFQQNGQRI